MHDLDLAKVAKAYGFSVPPAVNIPIGTSTKGAKRKSRDDEQDDEADANEEDEENDSESAQEPKRHERPKRSRNNTMQGEQGRKMVDKKHYSNGNDTRNTSKANGTQWGR